MRCPKLKSSCGRGSRGVSWRAAKFRRQYSVGSFVIDFYSPEVRLGVELDGDSHFREGANAYDERRTRFITSFGIRIMRFLNADVDENLDGVLETIGQAVLERRALFAASHPPAQTPLAPLVKGGKGEEPRPGARQRPSPAKARRRELPRSRAARPGVRALSRTFPPLPFPPLRRGGQGG